MKNQQILFSFDNTYSFKISSNNGLFYASNDMYFLISSVQKRDVDDEGGGNKICLLLYLSLVPGFGQCHVNNTNKTKQYE